MPNHPELYFTPDSTTPHQKWSVLEDPENSRGSLLYRHYRQSGEKPDVKTSFGISEVSPVLEHYAAKAGIEYSRLSLGRQRVNFDAVLVFVQSRIGMEIPGDGPWYPVIPWVRDDGFSAVLMREPIPYVMSANTSFTPRSANDIVCKHNQGDGGESYGRSP